jgi:DNA-binding HxlR family transcriptional regulator
MKNFIRQIGDHRILDRIGDKWAALVLGLLDGEPQRVNQSRRSIEGLSQKMLSRP